MDDSSQNRKSIASGTISIGKNNQSAPKALSKPKKATSLPSVKKDQPITQTTTPISKPIAPAPVPYSNPSPQPMPYPSSYPPAQSNMGYNDPYASNWNNPPNNQWGSNSYQSPTGQTNLTMEQG